MSSHTPGPWFCNKATGTHEIESPRTGQCVAHVHPQKTEAETDANARLSAAAPEMYDLVKELGTVTGSTAGLLIRARALLAKIERA